MARGGTGEQCANSLNGLAAATNDAADVSSSKLQLKDGCSAARNFREDHVVRKFDQLPNDELEKLSHGRSKINHEWTRIDTNFFRLILEVSRFEIFRVFANRPHFLAVGPQQPKPIVAAAADEIAMLRDQKTVAILA
jgi:hypothetical protein